MSNNSYENRNDLIPEDIYNIIIGYLDKIKFGSITLTIQDGRIVQIESSEKIRTSYKK